MKPEPEEGQLLQRSTRRRQPPKWCDDFVITGSKVKVKAERDATPEYAAAEVPLTLKTHASPPRRNTPSPATSAAPSVEGYYTPEPTAVEDLPLLTRSPAPSPQSAAAAPDAPPTRSLDPAHPNPPVASPVASPEPAPVRSTERPRTPSSEQTPTRTQDPAPTRSSELLIPHRPVSPPPHSSVPTLTDSPVPPPVACPTPSPRRSQEQSSTHSPAPCSEPLNPRPPVPPSTHSPVQPYGSPSRKRQSSARAAQNITRMTQDPFGRRRKTTTPVRSLTSVEPPMTRSSSGDRVEISPPSLARDQAVVYYDFPTELLEYNEPNEDAQREVIDVDAIESARETGVSSHSRQARPRKRAAEQTLSAGGRTRRRNDDQLERASAGENSDEDSEDSFVVNAPDDTDGDDTYTESEARIPGIRITSSPSVTESNRRHRDRGRGRGLGRGRGRGRGRGSGRESGSGRVRDHDLGADRSFTRQPVVMTRAEPRTETPRTHMFSRNVPSDATQSDATRAPAQDNHMPPPSGRVASTPASPVVSRLTLRLPSPLRSEHPVSAMPLPTPPTQNDKDQAIRFAEQQAVLRDAHEMKEQLDRSKDHFYRALQAYDLVSRGLARLNMTTSGAGQRMNAYHQFLCAAARWANASESDIRNALSEGKEGRVMLEEMPEVAPVKKAKLGERHGLSRSISRP